TVDWSSGESESMRAVRTLGRRCSQDDEPVFIIGENGTGKDMLAQAIHTGSARRTQNFVSVNCAAIPYELLESELFGYEAGAFTGAKKQGKKGKFELASGGTIFLDEIGELPLSLQAKLLRVLENHEIQKLGQPRPIHVDFRLISATNRDIDKLVAQGMFREDLFYRINLFDIVVPPLRERIADIPLLVRSITKNILGPEKAARVSIEQDVFSVFSLHQWKGNVRELQNVITYALYSMSSEEKVLKLKHLPQRFFCKAESRFLQNIYEERDSPEIYENADQRYHPVRVTPEQKDICRALEKSGGNKAKAARILGISRSYLYILLKEYGI
uniref:sigma-54 interaction domain-containing protein n=1 Tax=Bilophila wadsworthia TaxID=35833 RepID=UPI00242F330D